MIPKYSLLTENLRMVFLSVVVPFPIMEMIIPRWVEKELREIDTFTSSVENTFITIWHDR